MSDALHLPDRVLVDRLLAGDPEAADLFVTRFSRLVWAVLVRDFSLPGDRCDDVFQDVFVRLMEDDYRRIRMWHGEGDFAAYLAPIVRRRALDHLRTRHPERERPLETGEHDDWTAREPGPEERARVEEQRDAVERALSELPERDRELWRLRCDEELSYKEIAARLGMTVNNVGVRLARLTEKLKKAVERPRKPQGTGTGVRLPGPGASPE